MATFKDIVTDLQAALKTLGSQLNAVASEILQETQRHEGLLKEIEEKKAEYAVHYAKVEAAKLEHATIAKAIETINSEKDYAEGALARAQQAIANLKAQL